MFVCLMISRNSSRLASSIDMTLSANPMFLKIPIWQQYIPEKKDTRLIPPVLNHEIEIVTAMQNMANTVIANAASRTLAKSVCIFLFCQVPYPMSLPESNLALNIGNPLVLRTCFTELCICYPRSDIGYPCDDISWTYSAWISTRNLCCL